jgi:hypothetical protein
MIAFAIVIEAPLGTMITAEARIIREREMNVYVKRVLWYKLKRLGL